MVERLRQAQPEAEPDRKRQQESVDGKKNKAPNTRR